MAQVSSASTPGLGPSNTTSPTGTMPTGAAAAGAGTSGAVMPLFPFFTPSFNLALTGSAAVSAIMVIHIWLVYKTKALYFNLAPQAAMIFAVGLILRLMVIIDQNLRTPFTISTILLTIPGSLVGLMVIFTYTRLIWWVTPIERRDFSTLWLPIRANSFCLALPQTIGDVVGILGSGQVAKSPGPRTMAIGAVLMMLVWMFLAALVMRFTYISRRWPLEKGVREGSLQLGLALSASTVLLSVRGIMQVLEKDALQALIDTQIPISIVTTQEWPVWAFDYLPNFAILVILAVYHPGFYLPRRLTGFSLKTKGLVQEARARKLEEEMGVTALSNGWIISTPSAPNEIDTGMYAVGDEKRGAVPVGYTR